MAVDAPFDKAAPRWRLSISIVVLAILGIASTACQPATTVSTATLAITSPTPDEVAYGFLDVRLRAVDVDLDSVELRVDDGEPITATALRVDTRSLDDDAPHVIFASAGSLHARADFTVTHTAPDPIAGTVDAYADSITWQAADKKTPTALAELPAGNKVYSYPGLTAPSFFGTTSEEARQGRADVDIIALGNNDATWDRWDQTDVDNFRTLIGLTSSKTCVALMLPGYTEAFPADGRIQLDRARDGIRTIADDREATGFPTVVVDWQVYIDADPSIIAADGLHLAAEGPEDQGPVLEPARQARISALLEGIDACTTVRQADPDPEDPPDPPPPVTTPVTEPVPTTTEPSPDTTPVTEPLVDPTPTTLDLP